jgi:hypothetical protein
MSTKRAVVLAAVWALLMAAVATQARAEDRYALIVSGAAGGPAYDEQYGRWLDELSRTLTGPLGFPPAAVTVLRDGAPDGAGTSTAANVRQALDDLARRATRDDLVFLMLIGHGTFDGVDAKFNLVGPDLEARDWAALLAPVRARLVVVNAASAGFPFLERLAGPRRIVISATDTAAQRYDTVFPEFFIRALTDESADLDKNGRVSIWEAFGAATSAVRRFYQSQGRLSTERGLLDDTGDGVGHEADGTGPDGLAASTWYLDAPAADARPTDRELVRLLQRKRALEVALAELRIRKAFLAQADYEAEFERLMIELARVSRDIREKRGS